MSRWKAMGVALGVSVLVSVWMFLRPAPFALGGDNETLGHPLLVEAYRQLRLWRVPLWSAGRWGGAPLLGDPVAGVLYLPSYLGYALTPFPHWRALDVSVCLHLALLLSGLAWLLRDLGVSRVAAMMGAALLVVSNPTIVFIARSWNQYWGAIGWWPWLFAACVRLGHGATGGAGFAVAVALAAQVYAGYPQLALYSGTAGCAWALLAPGGGRARRLAVLAVAGLGAVGLALPQLLPGLAMARGSIRMAADGAERMAVLEQFALAPGSWLDVLRPTALAPLVPAKIAPVALVLAAIGALRGGFAARFLAALAVVTGVLATGPTAAYRLLHALPPFSVFGGPVKLFYLCAFATLVLAGLGLDAVLALAGTRRRVAVAALAVAAALSCAATPAASAGLLLASLALVVPRRVPDVAVTGLAVVAAGLFLAGSQALTVSHPFLPGEFMELLRREPGPLVAGASRVVALRGGAVVQQVGINFGALWGVEAFNGVGPLVQWRQADALERGGPASAARLVRQLGVDAVIVADGSVLDARLRAAGFRAVAAEGALRRLEPPGPPPARYQLIPHAEAATAARAVAAARDGTALDDDHVLVETTALAGGADGDPAGALEVVERRPGMARLRVAVARPTWLVAREPYYPGWRAAVDGQPIDMAPAAGFFMAVLIGGGEHEVVLEYEEPGFRPGVLAALLVAGALPLALRSRPRHRT